ncbi:MAG: hypothetical protein WDN28_13345 [Chthoniobacter sp.]
MNSPTFSILLLVVATSAFGAEKYSKEVPKVAVPTMVATTITLDARNVAAGRVLSDGVAPGPDATRKTTTHSETLEIHVGNLGTLPASVTVHWFWVGRYATSGNWYRAGDGEKTLAIDPKKSEVVLAEASDIEGHVTKGSHEHYQSGGNLLGWVVTVKNSQAEIQAVKASDAYLEGFAVQEPPKKRK